VNDDTEKSKQNFNVTAAAILKMRKTHQLSRALPPFAETLYIDNKKTKPKAELKISRK